MKIHIKNLKDYTHTHTHTHIKTVRIAEYSNIAGYKIIYRNLLHLNTLTANYQKEKLRKSHLQLHPKE